MGGEKSSVARLFGVEKLQCPDATITIEILTDTYGSETSWDVVEQGVGVIASGGGYASSTFYTEEVCVDSTSCYDVNIYDAYGDGIFSPGGYTVYYNGTEIADTMGGGFTGSQDTIGFIGGGCVLPTGACCEAGVCTGTVEEPQCAGDWYEGEDCATFDCPLIAGLDCPVDALAAQSVADATTWSAGTSEIDVQGSAYIRYETYSGAVGNICDLHWWGIFGFFDGAAWNACTDSDPSFEVKFYADAAGSPGAEVSSYVVTPTISPTNELLNGLFPLWYFSVPSLDPCTVLTDGWISIQGLGDNTCWFLWMSSQDGSGDGSNCFDDGTGIVCGAPDHDYDLSYCLTGAYEPIYGACCDDDTGTCDDGVELINCTGRFAADTLCADLDPPCGEIPGACCVGVVCSEVSSAECGTAGGTFLGEGTTCLPDICGCADATITIEILTDNYGSETSWDLVQLGVGVIASGSGYASDTFYTEDVCVDSAGCYEFTIYDAYGDGICCSYGNGYYNVLYNGLLVGTGGDFGTSETVGNIGDGCGALTGACCESGVCTGTVIEADCAGDWYLGEDCATFVCPVAVDTCPADTLFGQTPHGPDDAWSFGTSEIDVNGTEYRRYESYSVNSPICDIHWWGIEAVLTAAWEGCDDTDPVYEIKFWADAGGVPGAEVASYTVTPIITPTGILFGGLFDMAYFSVPTLDPCVTEFDGWVSIQGVGTDTSCWFLWASSPDGNGTSCIETDGVLDDCVTYLYDNAVCLTGQYVAQFGACCDDDTGVCDDNVEIIDCPGRFAADTLCADLDPACGQLPGACCYPDGSCLDQVSGDCIGTFQGPGTTCATTECPSPGDNCDNPVIATFPADLPYSDLGQTTCGRVDDYADTCLGSYDGGEDIIYEFVVTEDVCLNVIMTSDSSWTGMAIAAECPPGDPCLYSVTSSSSDEELLGVNLTAGTYYLMLDTWPSPTCINAFDLLIEQCPSGGACCHPDQSCDDVAGAGDCPDNYMGDGTSCATVSCPAPNDICDDAVNIDPVPAVVNGDLTGAQTETNPACGDNPANTPAQDLWYTVTGTGNQMRATVCGGTTMDTRISVFKGDNCGALECVGGNDDSPCARASVLRSNNTVLVPRGLERVATSALANGDMKRPAVMADKKAADPQALQSTVDWCSELGVTYYISMGTYSTFTTPGPFTMTVDDVGDCTYCPASGGCDEYIENVNVGTIDNTTACDGYADFTYLSTDMAVGAPYDITVTIGNAYSSDKGGLWIDWNQDLDFDDADETITIAWSGVGPYLATITPPAGATLGETRMRVRLQYSGGDPLPCGTTSYGEVEDYAVRVVPPIGACCDGTVCTDTEEGDCPGVWLGVGTECGDDCQPNGTADVCDLAYGTSPDCNANGIPDECEGPDCNGNGIPDDCDLASGFSEDCNANDVPDECDIAGGTSEDCQDDGIPDECQLNTAPRAVILEESFEGTFPPTGWENYLGDVNGPWEVSVNPDYVHDGAQSAVHPWSTPDYSDSYLLTPDLTAAQGQVSVWSLGCTDQAWCDFYDIDVMLVVGAPGGGDDVFLGNLNELWTDYFTTWKEGVFAYAAPSTPYRIGFRYYGLDGDLGVIDEVTIEETGAPANDCNENGVPDECDVPPLGSGPDCQPDGIPDECQLEDNDDIPPGGDGLPDECNGCGDGYVNPATGEECEGGVCCTEDCLFVFAGVPCRDSAGVCDLTEFCSGDAPDCPGDAFKTAGTECRASTDKCDPAEACTGSSPACPADFAITECMPGDACCPDGCTWQEDWDCAGQDPDIPTMSQWGMLVLALVLVVLAKLYFGRRRATA
jgi:hypothetical protein